VEYKKIRYLSQTIQDSAIVTVETSGKRVNS